MLDFSIIAPDETKLKLIYSRQFGFSTSKTDNSPEFRMAIDFMKSGGYKLIFEKGEYHFNSSELIILENTTNIVVDGNGSEFVFSDTGYFLIRNCSLVLFKNMVIDWDWSSRPIGDIARITNISDNCFEAEFFLLENIEPFTQVDNAYGYDSERLIPGINPKMFVFGTNKIKNCVKTNQKNKLLIYPEPGSFEGIEVGETYLFRFLGYNNALFLIESSSSITITDNLIYGVYGMVFIVSGSSHHYRVNNVTIGLKSSEPRRKISVSVDGFHVASSNGFGIVENCDFSYLGDDFINIHDNVSFCESSISDNTLLIEGSLSYRVGDKIEVIDKNFSNDRVKMTVSNIQIQDRIHAVLELVETIPTRFRGLIVIRNLGFDSSNYIIRNNHFHKSRARGMLLQSSNGYIYNNVIEQTTGAGVYIMHELMRNFWYEGYGAKNIIIRNNIFHECNLNNWFSVIDIRAEMFSTWDMAGRNPLTRSEETRGCPLFEDILVEENIFDNCPSLAFYLYVANNITIRNNRMINDKFYMNSGENRGMILKSSSTNINIVDNHSDNTKYCKEPFGILER